MDDFDFNESTSSPAVESFDNEDPFQTEETETTSPAAHDFIEEEPISSSPAIPEPSPVSSPAPSRYNDDFSSSFSEPAPISTPASSSYESSYEESPLSAWQAEHNRYLDEKARKGEEKRNNMIEEARDNTDKFYQNRTQQKEKNQAKNRTNQDKFIAERDAVLNSSKGASNAWANVASLIDLKQVPVGRDTSRMKKLLIELKH